jgi:hypothetical protein
VKLGYQWLKSSGLGRRAGVLGEATGISWGAMAAVIREPSSHLGGGSGAAISKGANALIVSATDPLRQRRARTPRRGGAGQDIRSQVAVHAARECVQLHGVSASLGSIRRTCT